MDWAANTSARSSTARISSPGNTSYSADMACENLLDGLSRPVFLFQRIFAQERRLGRPLHHQRAGREQPAYRAQTIFRRKGPEAGGLFGDDLHVAWEWD